jgi:hypothetical protein
MTAPPAAIAGSLRHPRDDLGTVRHARDLDDVGRQDSQLAIRPRGGWSV